MIVLDTVLVCTLISVYSPRVQPPLLPLLMNTNYSLYAVLLIVQMKSELTNKLARVSMYGHTHTHTLTH